MGGDNIWLAMLLIIFAVILLLIQATFFCCREKQFRSVANSKKAFLDPNKLSF